MKTLILSAALALAFPLHAAAADSLSLEQAQAQAADQSPDLRKIDADISAAQARCWVPLAGYLPSLNATGQHLLTAHYGSEDVEFFGESIAFPIAYPQDVIDISARWTFFDGFRGLFQWRAAGAELEALRRQRAHAAFRLRQDVAIRYYKALAARMRTEVAGQNVATLEDHLRLARDYEDSGSGTHFDVLRIRAQHEEALADATQAGDQEGLARMDLAVAMGLSQDARTLEGALPVPQEDLVPEGMAADLDQRDDLRAQALRLEALERRQAAMVSAWTPLLYLLADKQYYHYGDFNPLILPTNAANGSPTLGDSEFFGVAASWDLFSGGADLARLLALKGDVQSAREGLQGAKLQALREFDSWKRRYRDSARLYRARLRVLDQCRDSVRLAKLGLRAGTNTNSEVLDAELDLFRARDGLVQAQSDAAEAWLTLQLLKGGAPGAPDTDR
jgi:outer membrane protein TolC